MEAASVLTGAMACGTVDARPIPLAGTLKRHTRQGVVAWGDHRVTVGGDAPVRVQSMTNTDTADAVGTAIQVKELPLAGSELVRITVNNDEAAKAVPYIREQLDRMGVTVPLIGDFHYNGHRLLERPPGLRRGLVQVPHQSRATWAAATRATGSSRRWSRSPRALTKPIRIGVNWGSLDQDLLARLMDQNAQRAEPWDARQVMYEALDHLGARIRAACRRHRPVRQPHRAVLQGQRRAGPDRGLP